MKIFLFTLVSTLLFFTTQSEHSAAEIEKYNAADEKCLKESGLDPNVDIEDILAEADNKEFKCYLKCMMVERGTMDGTTGALDLDKIRSKELDLDPAQLEKIINECKNINDDDICEKAYKITKCILEEVKTQT